VIKTKNHFRQASGVWCISREPVDRCFSASLSRVLRVHVYVLEYVHMYVLGYLLEYEYVQG
jgi:hypothetical protein